MLILLTFVNRGAGPKAKNCFGTKQPLPGPVVSHPAEIVLQRVLSRILKPVYLLNITGLSQLRIDGHPSVYGYGGHITMDCSHWCLPGVPDIWNQLLYTALLQN